MTCTKLVACAAVVALGITSKCFAGQIDDCASSCWADNGCSYDSTKPDGTYLSCLQSVPTQGLSDCLTACASSSAAKARGYKAPARRKR